MTTKDEIIRRVLAAKEAPEALAPAPAPVAVFPAASAPAVAYAPAALVASAPTDASALWDKAVARVNQHIRAARERGF